MCRIWIGVREYLSYILRIDFVPLGNYGKYDRSIPIIISIMVLINNIIVGWSIRGVTKINLIVTRLYEITKGNITEFDMGRRLMGCLCVTQNGDLGWFRQFIPNNHLLLRQPIPPLLRHY